MSCLLIGLVFGNEEVDPSQRGLIQDCRGQLVVMRDLLIQLDTFVAHTLALSRGGSMQNSQSPMPELVGDALQLPKVTLVPRVHTYVLRWFENESG